MELSSYLAHLDTEYRRLRAAAENQTTAPVPSCPKWTMADLVRHVAEVYLHKAETMRLGEWPEPWPPDLTGEDPLAALHRGYQQLTGELTARKAGDPALTWFTPDQTVGFWARRMAQETVIHRIDAELAAGERSLPVPDELALDGIDEVLVRFLAFDTSNYADEFGDDLAGCDGRTVLVDAGVRRWPARLAPDGVTIGEEGANSVDAAATVSGDPDGVLRWLWRRTDRHAVRTEGDAELVDRLWRLLDPATQ